VKIVINDKELNSEEIEFLNAIILSGIEFHKETYNMAKDIAMEDTPQSINESLTELVGSEDEVELIMDVINGRFNNILELFK